MNDTNFSDVELQLIELKLLGYEIWGLDQKVSKNEVPLNFKYYRAICIKTEERDSQLDYGSRFILNSDFHESREEALQNIIGKLQEHIRNEHT